MMDSCSVGPARLPPAFLNLAVFSQRLCHTSMHTEVFPVLEECCEQGPRSGALIKELYGLAGGSDLLTLLPKRSDHASCILACLIRVLAHFCLGRISLLRDTFVACRLSATSVGSCIFVSCAVG